MPAHLTSPYFGHSRSAIRRRQRGVLTYGLGTCIFESGKSHQTAKSSIRPCSYSAGGRMNTMSEKESQTSRRLLGSFLLCEFRYCRAMLVAFAIPPRCCFFYPLTLPISVLLLFLLLLCRVINTSGFPYQSHSHSLLWHFPRSSETWPFRESFQVLFFPRRVTTRFFVLFSCSLTRIM